MKTHVHARRPAGGSQSGPLTTGASTGLLATPSRVRQIVAGPQVQAKLTVGAPDDAYEREADEVADRVMRMAQPAAVTPAGETVQRKCAACEGTADEPTPGLSPEERPHPQFQAKRDGGGEVPSDFAGRLGAGAPLDPASRSYFEPRFGEDLGHVRIHDGPEADVAAESINARAFTLGTDVVFAAGEHDPSSESGKRLLAHELTHVMQQGGGQTHTEEEATTGETPPEREDFLSTASTARIMLQRQEETPIGPPTAEEAAQAGLQGAARILSVENFLSLRIDQTNAVPGVPPDARVRYMLFEFWLAVAGWELQGESAESRYRQAAPPERLLRLSHANETAETVIHQLGAAPWFGQAREAVRAYREAYSGARARVMDDAVSAELESRPTPVAYEAPEIELEQQRQAVSDSLAALGQFALLASRLGTSTASRFGEETRAALSQIVSRAPAGSRLAGIASMPIPEAILHLRGVLNGFNAILAITHTDRRNQLLTTQLGVRGVAGASRVFLGLLEGLVATTCVVGSGLACLLGKTELASSLFRLGASEFVRRIGWVASLAQTVHGISILLDDQATDSGRLQAVLDLAMGSAGLIGAARSLRGPLLARLGIVGSRVPSLAGIAGPLSAGIVVTAGEVAYLRLLIRGMEEGMASAGIRQSFDVVEVEAGGVAHVANELAEAMSYSQEAAHGVPAASQPGELNVAADREVQSRSRRLREFLERAIDHVTQRQPEFAILFQPASWPHVSQPFEALRTSLQQATTPEALLAVASGYLEAARDLFRHLARTIARTLRDVDRSRSGGALPTVLGGLHDDRREQAGEQLSTF